MAGENILEKPAIEKVPSLPLSPEKIKGPDRRVERPTPTPDKNQEKKRPTVPSVGAVPAGLAATALESERAAAIDEILSAGLNEIFLKMKPAEQQEFKRRGEETVSKINQLLGHAKVKITKIIDLIKAWLKLIPGVNKFFLEQEAKIKADQIVKLKDKF